MKTRKIKELIVEPKDFSNEFLLMLKEQDSAKVDYDDNDPNFVTIYFTDFALDNMDAQMYDLEGDEPEKYDKKLHKEIKDLRKILKDKKYDYFVFSVYGDII